MRSQIPASRKAIIVLLILLGLFSYTFSSGNTFSAHAQGGYDPTVQTSTLLYDEARTVYLGNLARRDNGVPPLRWNLQLTHASRWFSWDSTENRPGGYCGHQDTNGNGPGYRALVYGYLGSAGWENAFCGYVTPEDAIQGWMNSPGHRANLLNPSLREIGLGYYRRDSDGRGYVTQGFGNDAVFAPVIIENESLSTTTRSVNLYIYDRSVGGGFASLSAATQMMVSNSALFTGAAWEPYNANKAWTLAAGVDGWRKVYVRTRDAFNRTLTVSDSIYLGANLPQNELGAAQMSTTQSQVTLYNLNGGSLPQVQFSLGWLADDTADNFQLLGGTGARENDAAAWGGTAFRLDPGQSPQSSAWVWDWSFIKDTPLVAYFRLRVKNNTSSSEVARISVEGGGTEYGPLSLRGIDFTAPDQYQEFALPFTFNTNSDPGDDFLIFQFSATGSAEVYVDAVSIFSAPQPITSPLTWTVPGNNYRGQGVWVRYTNGSQFSSISEASTIPTNAQLSVSKSGTGSGTVTSSPSGINCGSDCSEVYAYDTLVTLTAAPGAGSSFMGWSGGGCSGTGTCAVSLTQATTITANFGKLPGMVTLVSPSGIVDSAQPTFSWNADDLATWYYVRVKRPDHSIVFAEWYQPANICAANNCSVQPPALLTSGSYLWDVQTYNPAGYGPWSSTLSFTVILPLTPGAATLRAPSGTIISTQPVFSWDISPDDATFDSATWYYLWVNGPNGNVLKQWYEASAICSAGTCSVTPGLSPGSGSFSWLVQTWNSAGYGPWSTGMSFTLYPIGAATLLSPSGNIGSNYNPTYSWNTVSGATWYYLWVNGPSGTVLNQWYQASGICGGGTCSVNPGITLAGGAHAWWIQPWNPSGYGLWSDRKDFSTTIITSPPAVTSFTAPLGNIGTNYAPVFTWSAANSSTWYYLWVEGPSGKVLDQWYQASAICSGGTCSVNPGLTLGGGNHTWWVRTWNSAGYGPWSTGVTFTTVPLGAATLVSPSGSTANHNPTYSWNEVPGATWYYLWVNGPAGNVIKQWYSSSESHCNGGICSVTPATTLASASHAWWIQTWNPAGYGPWSAVQNFTVTP